MFDSIKKRRLLFKSHSSLSFYRISITTVIIFCTGLQNKILLAQEKDANAVVWSKNRKLAWSDFKYDVNSDSILIGEKAIIAPAFIYDIIRTNSLRYGVHIELYREGSVTIDTVSVDLLGHEQLHFDIAECFARKMRQKFAELYGKGCNNADLYNQVIDSIYNEYVLFQNQYDRETGHSVLRAQQVLWNKKVEAMLDDMKEYELPEPYSK